MVTLVCRPDAICVASQENLEFHFMYLIYPCCLEKKTFNPISYFIPIYIIFVSVEIYSLKIYRHGHTSLHGRYTKYIFFFVAVQISMQTRWARKVSSCIGATSWQLFLDRRYIYRYVEVAASA